MAAEKIIGVNWFLYDPKLQQVCLHRRDSKAPIDPDVWDNFGGTVEEGESELNALRREIIEELGIDLAQDAIEYCRLSNKVFYYIPFEVSRTSEIVLGEGAGFAWLTFAAALGLKDMSDEGRAGLRLLAERFEK